MADTITKLVDIMNGATSTLGGGLNVKNTGRQKFSKLSDYLLSCSIPDREKLLDDIVAAAPDMPIASLKRLSTELSAVAKSKELKASRKGQRLALLAAAMHDQADEPEVNARVELARGELRRLGLSLNEVPADGFDHVDLNNRIRAANWSDERRHTLLSVMATIGLIEP
jgi:Asp-tRNA(Asn)/Glu-tRNA(Gln) amidotransferase A subunit family amidase